MLHFKNSWHLGDVLYQLHYQMCLWRDGGHKSVLYCKPEYHLECCAFIPCDMPIVILPLADAPPEAIDSWIGTDGFFWNHPKSTVYDEFYVEWFKHLSSVAGVKCPINCLDDMDFWSPRIPVQLVPPDQFDFLIINAPPHSNQWDHEPALFQSLAMSLLEGGHHIISTHPLNVPYVFATVDLRWPLVKVAKLAGQCRTIIGIDTGPMGCTFNKWSRPEARLILHNRNSFARPGCHAIRHMREILPKLRELDLL